MRVERDDISRSRIGANVEVRDEAVLAAADDRARRAAHEVEDRVGRAVTVDHGHIRAIARLERDLLVELDQAVAAAADLGRLVAGIIEHAVVVQVAVETGTHEHGVSLAGVGDRLRNGAAGRELGAAAD